MSKRETVQRYKVYLWLIVIIAIFGVAYYYWYSHYLTVPTVEQLLEQEHKVKIPDVLLEKSNAFIISKVGKYFFDRHIALKYGSYWDPNRYCSDLRLCTGYLARPYYAITYSMKIPEKPFVDENIDLKVDLGGNIIENYARGLPDCIRKPDSCIFDIDEGRAKSIARQAGLKEGLTGLHAEFEWIAGNINSYVWTVYNILRQDKRGGSGEVVQIDANSGKPGKINLRIWQP